MALPIGLAYGLRAAAPIAKGIMHRIQQDKAKTAFTNWLNENYGGGSIQTGDAAKAAAAAQSGQSATPAMPAQPNPMAAGEQTFLTGQSMDARPEHGYTSPQLYTKEQAAIASRVSGQPVKPDLRDRNLPPAYLQGGSGGGSSARTGGSSASVGGANPATMPSGRFSPMSIARLQEALGSNPYGDPYLKQAMMLVESQMKQDAIDREMALQQYKMQAAEEKARRDLNMDMFETLSRNRGLEFNPEAVPHLGADYVNQIYSGNFDPSVTVPGDVLPSGAAGPVRDERQVPVFRTKEDEVKWKLKAGKTTNAGTVPYYRYNDKGEVELAFEQQDVRLPSRGGTSMVPWNPYARFEKDPTYRRLHNVRYSYGPYLTELQNAKKRLAQQSAGQGKRDPNKPLTSEEAMQIAMGGGKKDQQGVALQHPTRGQRKFTSMQEINDEIKEVRQEYDKATNMLKNSFGWTPDANMMMLQVTPPEMMDVAPTE